MRIASPPFSETSFTVTPLTVVPFVIEVDGLDVRGADRGAACRRETSGSVRRTVQTGLDPMSARSATRRRA